MALTVGPQIACRPTARTKTVPYMQLCATGNSALKTSCQSLSLATLTSAGRSLRTTRFSRLRQHSVVTMAITVTQGGTLDLSRLHAPYRAW